MEEEERITSHGSLILTNKRLIQEKKSGFLGSQRQHHEIPLDKIDSITSNSQNYQWMSIFGAATFIFGFLFEVYAKINVQNAIFQIVGFSLVVIGIIFFIFGFLGQHQVQFHSANSVIHEKQKNIEPFVEKLREELYR